VVDLSVRGGPDETREKIIDWLRERGFQVTWEEREAGWFVHGRIAMGGLVELHIEPIFKEDAFGRSIHGEFYYRAKGLGNLEIAPTRKIFSLGWYPGGYKHIGEFVDFVRAIGSS